MHEEIRAFERTKEELDRLRRRLSEYEESEIRRERVDRAVRLSERYFRSLVENISDILTIMDRDGVIAYTSPSISKLLGYGEDDMLGRSILEYVHPADISAIVDGLAHVTHCPDDGVTIEFRFRNKDGSWQYFEGVCTGIVEGSETSGVILSSRDITERRVIEDELRQSEQYYRSLIRNSGDMITVLDADFNFLWGSPTASRITGYLAQEIYGRPVLDFIHPDDIEKVRKKQALCLRNPGVPLRFDFRFRHKDGSYHHYEGIVNDLIDDPAVRGIVANTRDITERKVMEENLREHRERLAELIGERTQELQKANEQLQHELTTHQSLEELLQKKEEYYRSLIENSYDVIGVLGRDGLIKYTSPSSKETFGYKSAELEGKNALDYVHPDDLPQVIQTIERGVDIAGYIDCVEFRWKHGDGSWRYIEATGTNMLENPAIAGIVVHARDVGERWKANEELRRREEYFHALIDSTSDLIIVVNDDLSIRFISPSVEKWLGYNPEEVVGKSSFDFLLPEGKEIVIAAKDESQQRLGDLIPLELKIKHKDGSWRVVEAVGCNLMDNPAVRGIVINSHDITERRLMEDFLRESESKYRNLVENMNDVVLTLDNQGLINYISPTIERHSRYRAEELIGRSFADFVHPDDISTMLERRERLYAGEEESPHEYRLLDKDGSVKYVRIGGRLIVNEGQVIGHNVVMSDITERKLAEDALRESEEKFRLLSEQSLLGMLIVQDDRIKYANQAAADIYEYPVEDIVSWGPAQSLKLTYPDDRASVARRIEKKQRGEDVPTRSFTFRVLAKSGKTKWVDTYSKTVPYQGKYADFITLIDISERVEMEEEIKYREERFRALIESSLDAIIILNAKGIVTFASPSVENVSGFKPEEMVGQTMIPFIHPFDVQKSNENLRLLLENPNEILTMRLRSRNKKGAYMYVEATSRNLLDNPAIQGIVVNYRDITYEKNIRDRLERINHLFLSMGVDLISNMEKIIETGRDVIGVSFAAYSRIEKGNLSILSTALGEDSLIITDQPEPFLSYEIISQGEAKPRVIEDLTSTPYRNMDPLISRRGFRSFLGYPVRGKEETIGCLGIYNMDKRMFTQDEIETLGMLARALSVEEERLSHEQGLKDFIDVASHELRHPITLMKGYALTLRDYGERLPDDAKRDYLTIIGQGADRLDMLIKELLDVSRIERGRFPLNKREVRLEPLIERAVGEMRGKGAPDKFTISIPEELPARWVDPEKLVRSMVILLDNATIHNPENTEVELTAIRQQTMVVISVMDKGVGVPEQDRERIFERFYQVEDAIHHSSPGMGLGLYIAREIIEAHGGRLWYEPRKGGGSIFRFSLP